MGAPEPYFESSDGLKLYHGDCREILPELGDLEFVLTDPPYGVNYSTWDKEVPQPDEWLYDAIANSRTVYVTTGIANHRLYPQPRWTMAWFRPGSTQRARGGNFSHWEPILVYGEHQAEVDAKTIKAKAQIGAGDHPCPKPIELWRWLLGTVDASQVVDPFSGSGTTLLAARLEGMRAIGIEIEEKYCEATARRLEQQMLPMFETSPALPWPNEDPRT